MRRAAHTAFLLAVLAAILAPGPASANQAQPVRCGDTITRDTKLKNDLVNCPGNGIVIGADDIELDLNGHTIDGDGVLGCTELYACDFGVDNTAGHHGVTIEDGSIREFATAVFVLGANHNRLRRLSASHNILGGLLLIESPGARIERNSISANGLTTDQAGLIVFDSSEIRIERNSVFDNGDIGMFLHRGRRQPSRAKLGVGQPGGRHHLGRQRERGQPKPRVAKRRRRSLSTGDGNTIVRNRGRRTSSASRTAAAGFGILIDWRDAQPDRAQRIRDVAGIGIRVDRTSTRTDGSAQSATSSAKSGVEHRARRHPRRIDCHRQLLERNVAIGAGDDGIDVDSATTSLSRNTANGNGDLGIEAVAGVTDLGGNRASGNGNPLQCVNVFCQ